MISDYYKLIQDVTDDYFSKFDDITSQPVDLIRGDLLKIVNEKIDEYNLGPRDESTSKDDPIKAQYPYQKQGSKRFKNLVTLHPYQVARMTISYFYIKRIMWSKKEDKDNFSLAIYHTSGEDEGIYDTSDFSLELAVGKISALLDGGELKMTLRIIKSLAPMAVRNDNPDLIAVNNGIFDYKEKKLLPFSPDYIFLTKSKIDFNPKAKLVDITMSDGEIWNVETWLNSLSDDPEVVNSLWEITSAILRPHVSWNKAIFLYSPIGNNGKGTYCELLRNLLGANAYSSISIKNFSKEFMLTPLLKVNAVIADENETQNYLENAENFKSAVTGDYLRINIKNKEPKDLVYKGLIVQCVNNVVKARDKSQSFYRRLLILPLEKRFEGIERKYIKDDYIKRQEVLEYVLYKALMSDFYEFSDVSASTRLVNEMKEINDPVRQFVFDVFDDFVWDLLPNTFLYDCYKSWFAKNMPSTSKCLSNRNFIKDLKTVLSDEKPEWVYSENRITVKGRITCPEPLIIKYNLTDWMNSNYKGSDRDLIATPDLSEGRYRGFLRKDD